MTSKIIDTKVSTILNKGKSSLPQANIIFLNAHSDEDQSKTTKDASSAACKKTDVSTSDDPKKPSRFWRSPFFYSFLFLAAILAVVFYFPHRRSFPVKRTVVRTNVVSPQTDCAIISTTQGDELKNMVKQASSRTGMAANSIHNKLKKKYGYQRFREMDCATFEKVVADLKEISSN